MRQRLSRPTMAGPLVLILATAVAILAYWPTLRLPLIYDDLLHIRIVKSLNLTSVWLPTEAFGFYRPMTFFPLLIIEALFGRYPPELLHGLNVAQHALNALLVAWLSWRLWGRLSWTLAAGLLLALFPFSYQAVAVYGHNVHPVTAGLLLLGLHGYLSAISRQGRPAAAWWTVTGLAFLLALLSHESALLFGFLAALVHWQRDGRLPNLRSSRGLQATLRQPWFLFAVAGLAYFVAYQFLPLSRAPQADFGGGALWYKLLYLLQAAGYPAVWLARLLPFATAIGAVLFGLGVALALTAWSGNEPGHRLALILGWSWWALASVVIGLPLSASYLLHGPRLLYLGSVGLALLWPVLLAPIYSLRRVGPFLWAAALLLILVPNWFFVRGRLQAYVRLTAPVDLVEQVMADRPADEGVLLVNLPQWLAPAESAYPIGVEFVAQLGDYLFIEELIGENLGVDRPVQAMSVPDLLAGQAYTYDIHEQGNISVVEADWATAGSHVFVTRYLPEGPQTEYVGRLLPMDGSNQPVASFGPYELLAAEARRCANEVRVTSTWQLAASGQASLPAPTTTLFSQLLSAEGSLISQADGPPLSLRPDLLVLPGGWQATDMRVLPDENQVGEQLLLGVYDFVSGQRHEALDAAMQPLADDALRLGLQPCGR